MKSQAKLPTISKQSPRAADAKPKLFINTDGSAEETPKDQADEAKELKSPEVLSPIKTGIRDKRQSEMLINRTALVAYPSA